MNISSADNEVAASHGLFRGVVIAATFGLPGCRLYVYSACRLLFNALCSRSRARLCFGATLGIDLVRQPIRHLELDKHKGARGRSSTLIYTACAVVYGGAILSCRANKDQAAAITLPQLFPH